MCAAWWSNRWKGGTMEHDQREAIHFLSIELIWFASVTMYAILLIEQRTSEGKPSLHINEPLILCFFFLFRFGSIAVDRREIRMYAVSNCGQKPFLNAKNFRIYRRRRHGSCQNHVFHQLAGRSIDRFRICTQ